MSGPPNLLSLGELTSSKRTSIVNGRLMSELEKLALERVRQGERIKTCLTYRVPDKMASSPRNLRAFPYAGS